MDFILNILEYLWYKFKYILLNVFIYCYICSILFLPILIFAFVADNNEISTAMLLFGLLMISYIILPLVILRFLPDEIRKKDIMYLPNTLLFFVERQHALWRARKYLMPYSSIRGNLILQNHNVTVMLMSDKSKTVLCQNNQTGQKIKTKIKQFIRESSKHELWAYHDIWNLICQKFDSKTDFRDIIALFDVNNKSTSYNLFISNYNSYKRFKSKLDKYTTDNTVVEIPHNLQYTEPELLIDTEPDAEKTGQDDERHVDI